MRRRVLQAVLFVAGLSAATGAGVRAQDTDGGAPEPLPEAVVGVLPFLDTQEPNRVMIDLAPEGHRTFAMFLDTGAATSIVTPRMARSLGVSVRRTKKTPYVRPTRLGRDLNFWIDTRITDTSSPSGWEFGVLGADFLDDYVLEIDFPKRVVRFLDPKRYEVPKRSGASNESVVPLQLGGTRAAADITIADRSVSVLLDTGTADGVILSGHAARRLDIDVESLPDLTEYGTVIGNMRVRLYETEQFRFGGFAFDRMPVMVAPRGWYNQASSSDSVVGVDVLRQFRLRIDYARRRLWLQRTGDPGPTYLGLDYALTRRSGAFIGSFGGRYAVIGVLPDSPAARLGLRPGDWIEPNARAVDLERSIRRIEAGEPLTVGRDSDEGWVEAILAPDGAPVPAPPD
jgi:predicted aspartyl protease